MDTQVSHKEIFIESFDRCVASNEFFPSFYKCFMSKSKEVKRKFLYTDFNTQNRLLERSLRLVAAATVGEKRGLQELRERAETHNRYNLDIKPEFYELWRVSVIETARQFDQDWNEEIDDAWNSILGYAIDYLSRRY